MDDAQTKPAPRWVPYHLVDEVTPPSRPLTDDWLLDRKPVEGACILLGWEDEADNDSRRTVAIGETVKFSAIHNYPSVRLRVEVDGTWTSGDPVPADAESFYCPDNEILADSISELVREFHDAEPRDEAQELFVRAYTWTGPQAFVLQLAETGEATFKRCDA